MKNQKCSLFNHLDIDRACEYIALCIDTQQQYVLKKWR